MSQVQERDRHDSGVKLEPEGSQKEPQSQAVAKASIEKAQFESLIKGFSSLCVAAGFIAAIQSQLLGYALDTPNSRATRATKALFLGGLLIDIMSAMMGYLTIRWLERMRDAEQKLLDKLLHLKTNGQKADGTRPPANAEVGENVSASRPNKRKDAGIDFDRESIDIARPRLVHQFMALSLLIPFPFLVVGCICMLVGIYVYVWSQLLTSVAVAVTILGGSTVPFIVCDCCIGRDEDRRKFIIRRICELQGDW